MNRIIRHFLGFLAIGSGLLTSGCSDQGEGERCDFELSGNTASGHGRDCEKGLECVSADQLLLGDGTDRCCPPADQRSSDERCRRTSVAPTGTGGAVSGGAGSAGFSGSPAGGAAGLPAFAGAGGAAAGAAGSSVGGQSGGGAAGALAGAGG